MKSSSSSRSSSSSSRSSLSKVNSSVDVLVAVSGFHVLSYEESFSLILIWEGIEAGGSVNDALVVVARKIQ